METDDGEIGITRKSSKKVSHVNFDHRVNNWCDLVDVDSFLTKFSAVSKFQIFLIIVTTSINLLGDYHDFLIFFIGHDSSWKCSANSTSHFCTSHRNVTISNGDDLFDKRCTLNRSEWTYSTDKDFSFVTEFDLVCSKTWIMALNGALYHVGGVISAAFGGLLADKYGRKLVIIIPFVIIIFTSITSSFVTNPKYLLIWNFLRGVGHGYRYPSFVYVAELAHPAYRTVALNIVGLGSCSSSILIDLVAFLVPNWRTLLRYVSLPLIFPIVSMLLLPESPRWLLATKKERKTEAVLTKIARFNDKNFAGNIRVTLTKDTKGVSANETYTYLDLIRGKRVFFRTAVILTIWFITPLLYLAIALQTHFDGGSMYKTYAFSALAEVPAILIEMILIEKLGRKRTILGGLLLSGVFLACFYFVPDNASWSYALNMTIAVVARLAISVTFNGIFVWTPELFPTVLRSQGLCVCGIFDRAGMVAVPFIWSLLQSRIHKGTFLFMSALAIFAFLIGLTLPETKGKPLQENYEDFLKDTNGTENKRFEKDEVI